MQLLLDGLGMCGSEVQRATRHWKTYEKHMECSFLTVSSLKNAIAETTSGQPAKIPWPELGRLI
jgi:NifU-like protein involved in Fe-S cluster formation